MKIISVDAVTELLQLHGLSQFMEDLSKSITRDFLKWESFSIIPRPAMHVPNGVLELMPICDNSLYYSFKYVNCHPKNPLIGKQTVVATGQLCSIDTGYPLIISEMTLLTAFRTAATSALATQLMSRKNSEVLAIIGTGAQSEFQAIATQMIRDIKEVKYFDTDSSAMDKFEESMSGKSFTLVRCKNVEEAVLGADIVTVCTACKAHVDVIRDEWIKPGVHINALGGDTVGKTELASEILKRSKIVVEYFEQSFVEGEIQRLSKKEAKQLVYAELYEIVSGVKKGRVDADEVTIFDSVGIALEDYSVLRLIYELAEKYNLGKDISLVPQLNDPKNLYSLVKGVN